jgi:hypothetical protein
LSPGGAAAVVVAGAADVAGGAADVLDVAALP